jgi:hypothetical protein
MKPAPQTKNELAYAYAQRNKLSSLFQKYAHVFSGREFELLGLCIA